jgi:putative transposase
MRELAKGAGSELSEKAKFRLKVFDWYFRRSKCFSLTGVPDASLTCRHFGIRRSHFYRWMAHCDMTRLASLESRPPVPNKKRSPCYSREIINAVRDMRKEDPSHSAKKIRPMLLRTMSAEDVPSAATTGRLISRENLFFRPDVNRRKKHSNSAKKAHERKRKPYDLKADGARKVIEFDMKHIYLLGVKLYAFCAIDPFTKESVLHIGSSPSSRNAKTALEKTTARFGKNIAVANDNGSENMKDAQAHLLSEGITQYWTRPHSPKEKPFVERFIGTFQKECLDCNYDPMNATELRKVADAWLDKCHFYRPHESLEFLTPAEFCANLGLSIPRTARVL